MYYNKCPACGANLDPGEHCDCGTIKKENQSAPTKATDSLKPIKMTTPTLEVSSHFYCTTDVF